MSLLLSDAHAGERAGEQPVIFTQHIKALQPHGPSCLQVMLSDAGIQWPRSPGPPSILPWDGQDSLPGLLTSYKVGKHQGLSLTGPGGQQHQNPVPSTHSSPQVISRVTLNDASKGGFYETSDSENGIIHKRFSNSRDQNTQSSQLINEEMETQRCCGAVSPKVSDSWELWMLICEILSPWQHEKWPCNRWHQMTSLLPSWRIIKVE
ncbi:uncharacterized protein LOC129658653 isoform X2 [Bubalus kerabau]|uniref:uncharacterized protein LOC129658653 isoform X2 n=1 Tax=Bubalus carabanensis TaxID=3119969 RepID=UPI00244E7EFF|nr:uncharacterized protein LOC129658653 isoform X2 [Bubalus carabanensis]